MRPPALGGTTRKSGKAWVEGLTREEMLRRLDAARQKATEAGERLQARAVPADPRWSAGRYLKEILRPFQPFFAPNRFSGIHFVPLLGVPPDTWNGWIRGRYPMPLWKFFDLINFIRIDEPSWLFYLVYEKHLAPYFDAQVEEGRMVLLTKEGAVKRERPIDYDLLCKYGFGGVLTGGMELYGLTLTQVTERIDQVRGKGTRTDREVIGRFAHNREIPNKKNNSVFLDLLIETVPLDPSMAFLGAGWHQAAQLILIRDHHLVLAQKGLQTGALAALQTYPYEFLPIRYGDPEVSGSRKAARRVHEFGGYLTRIRRWSGLQVAEAERVLEMKEGALKKYEVGISERGNRIAKPPLRVLRRMARHYHKGIKYLAQYSDAPLHELLIRYHRFFFPEIPLERLLNQPALIFLRTDRDGRLAGELLPLPKDDPRRRIFIYRISRDWDSKRLAQEIHVSENVIRKLENVACRPTAYQPVLEAMASRVAEEKIDPPLTIKSRWPVLAAGGGVE